MREVIRHVELGTGHISCARFAMRDGMDELLLRVRWDNQDVPAGWYWWDDPNIEVSVLALARSSV